MERPGRYVPAGFYLLRAPALPAEVFRRVTAVGVPPRTSAAELPSRWAEARRHSHDELRRHAADPVVRRALAVASGDLRHGLRRIEHPNGDAKRIDRAYATLFRYMVRMSTRPTPFGLFAGVAFGTLRTATTARLGPPTSRCTRTRPDMRWLLALIDLLEQERDLVRQLDVHVNPLAYVTGTRVVLPHADPDGKEESRAVTLHAGPVLAHVLRVARRPIAFDALRRSLLQAFPHGTEERIDALLEQLREHRVLATELRPRLTDPAPGRHVLEHLRRAGTCPATERQLAGVLEKAGDIDLDGAAEPAEHLAELAAEQRDMVQAAGPTLQVDTALALADRGLHAAVGHAVADAADVLMRLAPGSQGPLYLQQYKHAFIDRYGGEAEIPVKELLSPERGLDAPPTYRQPPRTYTFAPTAAPDTAGRDDVLCAVLAEALHTGAHQVELDDRLVEALAGGRAEAEQPLPPVEMYLQIAAASREAIDRGEWQGVVTPHCLCPGGQVFGRFGDILGGEAVRRLRAYARSEEDRFPDVLFAELGYLPVGRGANVAIHPLLRSHEIVVNGSPSVPAQWVLDPDDIVVSIRRGRFHLRSLRHGKQVKVRQSHMFNLALTPNLCRFLVEASDDGTPVPQAFDWGVVSVAPRLPRLVRGRIVLSPARWNLPASAVPHGTADAHAFFTELQRWRARWEVPRHVYLTQSDARLLLDLEHPLSAEQLRKELAKAESVRLEELLPDFEQLWLEDAAGATYFSEVVVPLLPDVGDAGTRDSAAAQRDRRPVHRPVTAEERFVAPGGAWTYLKLYAPVHQHDELIAGPLRELTGHLQEAAVTDRWFFVRYGDPEPHLRLRFHAAAPSAEGTTLTMVLAWARVLAEVGAASQVAVDTYIREVERYGGPGALEAMEHAFGVESTVVAEIAAARSAGSVTLAPELVTVHGLDQLLRSYGLDAAGRLRFASGLVERDRSTAAVFREHRGALSALLAPGEAPDGALHDLWAAPAAALRQVFAPVRALAASGRLWTAEEGLLASVAHMHVNRQLGVGVERERMVYGLWCHTLDSLQRRRVAAGADA